jgi:hypothetical protein
MNIEKYKKNALSKRRQHSSNKPNAEDHPKIYEEPTLITHSFESPEKPPSVSSKDPPIKQEDSGMQKLTSPSFQEKPWLVYLKTLRIPIICPIHRKLFLLTSSSFKAPSPRAAAPPVVSKNKPINRNPNCNHNSSQFYNSCLINVKMDRELTQEMENDLLWKNSELYGEADEVQALGGMLKRLVAMPKLGERKGDVDVVVDGRLVNKYSLWTLK